MKKFGDRYESKENSGYGSGGDHKDESPKTLSPSTPSPSSLVKRRKKKLKEIMHVKISSKKVEKPKSDIVTSDPSPKLARSKRANGSCKTRAVIRAEEVLSSLNPKFPSCLKTMVRSHVSSCFWMGLSTEYCNSHLPKKDMMVTVEDESGKEFQIKYFSARTGLSGGWRNFAIMHKLHEGDVLIFQLVEPLEPIKLKVYIIRDNDVKEEDGPLNLDENNQQNDAGKDGPEICQKAQSQHTTKRRSSKSLRCDVIQKKKQTGSGKSVHKTLQQTKKIKTSDQEPDLEIISGPSSSSSRVQFKDVKSFEDFTIMAEDLCIDSELPDDIRLKYYELCLAKKAFLHARLMQGLNCKLIAGIISETVNIADSIKACSLTTCRGEYSNWERALKSFHFLGMSVGFMHVRIRKLVALAFESDGAAESRKYMEAKLEQVRAEDEMANLKSKFVELKETFKKCGGDVKALKSKAEGYEHMFQEEVGAPW